MKCAATAGLCALLLCVLVAESRARSLSDPAFLSRWRRGSGVEWNCGHRLDGCFLHLTCTSNLRLELHFFRCILDNNATNDLCQAGINNGDGADFRINLREAKVIDGREYGLRITARGTYGSAYAILPWYIRFLVSPDDCPAPDTTQTPTRPPTPSPTPTIPSQQPTTVVCNSGLVGSDIVINCTSLDGGEITSISYFINGVPVGSSVGSEVRIAGDRLNEGDNSVLLTVTTSDGSTHEVRLTVQVQRSTEPPSTDPPCRFECGGRFSSDGQYLDITCTVDGSGAQITSIVYTINDGELQLADRLPSFRIDTSLFLDGNNNIALTVSHSECGTGNLNLNVQFQRSTNPSPSCGVTCRYLQVDEDIEFTCNNIGDVGQIASISHSINGARSQPASLSSGGVFRIPLSVFQNGDNTVDLSILVLCEGSVVTLDRSLILSVQVPRQEAFTATVVSVDPENYGSLVASFPITCEVAVEVDNLAISVSSTGSQRVLLIGFSVNGDPVDYRVGAVVRIPKDVFVNGQNRVELTVFGNGGARIDKTITLRVQKGSGGSPVPTVAISCSIVSDRNNAIITCSPSDKIVSISYLINGIPIRSVVGSVVRISRGSFNPGVNSVLLNIYGEDGSSVERTYTVNVPSDGTPTPPPGTPTLPANCNAREENGIIVFTCSSAGTEQISSITYRVNGGGEINANSVSGFEVPISVLQEGENTIIVTLTGVNGATREVTTTLTLETVIPCRFGCNATYDGNDASIVCYTIGESEDISSVAYSINGGTSTAANSVSQFIIDGDLLTRDENTIVLTLTCDSGASHDLTLSLGQPLHLTCRSETQELGVDIDCTTNRQSSSLTLQCFINGQRQQNCALDSFLQYGILEQGRQTFTIIVTDSTGLSARNQLSFENNVIINCRGSLNLGSNTYSVDCDSSRSLDFYLCQLDGIVIPCPDDLVFDVSSLSSDVHTYELTGRDQFGATATATSQIVIPEKVGLCDIDSDRSDDVIDWTCSSNVQGASIVCLLNGVHLEDCLCRLISQIRPGNYPPGDYILDLILTSNDGRFKNFSYDFTVDRTLSAQVEPLDFSCGSSVGEDSITITTSANKPVSLTCSLVDASDNAVPPYPRSCGSTNVVNFQDLTSAGPFTYTIAATDQSGLVDRCQINFDAKLHISCHGSYDAIEDVIHLSCDSNRPLAVTECLLNDGSLIQCPTPLDIPVGGFVNNRYRLRVQARDDIGNRDSQELVFYTF